MKDNPLSPEDGLVDAQVVVNTFNHLIRRLTDSLGTSQSSLSRDLIELLESGKHSILKHRKSPSELLKANPQIKAEAIPSQKEAHEKRMQGIKSRQ